MRLKLDLSEFLNDERRLSLLCVKTEECRTVGDVISRICQVFSVGPKDGNGVSYVEVALFDDGFFIHPSQCSSVLEGGGVLKLQWLRSQEVIKKKKKNSIDDIELLEVKRIKVEIENKHESENKKGKSKRQSQENESTQAEESDLDSSKKKRKKKTQSNESEVSKKYKKPLAVCEINEKGQLISESECSWNPPKNKMNNNDINNCNDNKEVVEINHAKNEVKASKRKKHLSQEHIEKEKAVFAKDIESSTEEVTVVDSLKGKKSKLKKIGDAQNVKLRKNIVPDKNVVDSNSSDNISIKDSYIRNVKCHNEYKKSNENIKKLKYHSFEATDLTETSKTVPQVCTENIAKYKNVDMKQEKSVKEQEIIHDDTIDSENNEYNDNEKFSKKGRKRRRKRKKPNLSCVEEADSVAQFIDTSVVDTSANFLVPNAKISSSNSRKTIETQMYNFSYSRPKNKKPMTGSVRPQNKHIIFNCDDDVTIEKSVQKIDSVDDNVTKRPPLKGRLCDSLWDLSDIAIINNSHYDTTIPGTSTPIIPPLEIAATENSCNEISSTSMNKLTVPSRIKKINTDEENERIFGNLLEMSKSKEPTVSTYVGRKVKEKPINYTGTLTSAMEQHQRQSPPKGVPTHVPQNDEVSHIFHNLLATQNFSQAFICPRMPPTSKLTCVENANKQQVFSGIGMSSSNGSGLNAQQRAITNLSNDNSTCLEAKIVSKDIIQNDDILEDNDSEKEMEEMRKFTKLTVEANIAEEKAAMNRRKRARPKVSTSVGTLISRLKSGGISIKEESECSSSEVQSIDIEDKLNENITSTIATYDAEILKYNNETSILISNVQTVEDENLNSGEEINFKSTDQDIDLIPECKELENCEIEAINNINQKNKTEENKEIELTIKDEEVNVVEPDIEVSEIKESDCVIVNAVSDNVATVSSNRSEQLLSGGVQSSKLQQSLNVTRSSIKTVITVKDEENTVISPKKETKSYNELGEAFFDQFPLMKVLPKVKEFVAVKLLSLDEMCIPVYSNYQQAQVLKVQGTSVTLRYIDKLEKLPSKYGQVQVVDLTMEGEGTTETVDWRDVHEPRLIFP